MIYSMAKDKKDLSNILVNAIKAKRAIEAVNGKVKPLSAEASLLVSGRAAELEGDELVIHVYRGLGGLVDEQRATQNRKNERKMAAAKAAR